MKNFVFSNFAKAFRKYDREFSSDEECVNTLFGLVTEPLSNDNEKYAAFHIDKSDVSDIMRRKNNVPLLILEGIKKVNFDSLVDGFSDLIKEDLDEFKIADLEQDIRNLYISDTYDGANLMDSMMKDSARFLAFAFYQCLLNQNRYELYKVLWQSGNNRLIVEAGNILSLAFDKRDMRSKIIVIPVDADYTMKVQGLSENKKKLISPQSIHGKWLKRVGEDKADKKVRKYLSLSKTNSFIGNVIPYCLGKTVFYLWAISKLDENKNAHVGKEQLISAIEDLIFYYDQNGQGYPMYIPLIGTGMSRAGLSYKESFDMIKDVCLKNTQKITGSISIMPYINDLDKMEDLKNVL